MKTLILEIEDKDWEVMRQLGDFFGDTPADLIQRGLNKLKDELDNAKLKVELTHV